jgi:hypothetical protein
MFELFRQLRYLDLFTVNQSASASSGWLAGNVFPLQCFMGVKLISTNNQQVEV